MNIRYMTSVAIAALVATQAGAQAGQPAATGVAAGSSQPSKVSDGTLPAPSSQPQGMTDAGEIIVTAERRSSTVHEVPFSIAAFGGAQLRAQQVFSVQAITENLPGISVNTADRTLAVAAIRGNVSTFRTATLDTPVAFFVDDIYFIYNSDLNSNFFDVNRVEVLRGPQGSLFGRNVVGGAIEVVTNNPTFTPDYFASVSGGNGGYVRTEGMIDEPLVGDKLAARIAFSTEHSDGLIDAPNQNQKFGEYSNESLRGKLLFQPSDALKLILSGDYAYTSGNGGAIQLAVGGPQVIPATFGPFVNKKFTNSDVAGAPYTQRLRGTYLRGDLDLLGGTLTSITGYRLNNSYTFLDNVPVATAVPVFGYSQRLRERSFSQEARYASAPGRFTYVVGAFYLSAHVGTNNNYNYSPLPGSSVGAAAPPNPAITNIDRIQSGKIRSAAVFGEATFKVTDKLSLIAGGRYTSDHKSIDYSATSGTAGNNPIAAFAFPGTVIASGGKTWNAFTPRVTAKWNVVEQVNLYATYSKGFVSGGYVDNAYANPTLPLEPEKSTNIESGIKARALDNRLNVNLSVFRQKTKNLQNFSGAGGFPHTYNGTVIVKGVELESSFKATDHILLNGNYAHTDGHYTSLKDPATGVDYAGNPIKYTPRDAFTVGATFDQTLNNGAKLTEESDFVFSSRTHTDDANTLPLYPNLYDNTRGRTLNARLTYDSPDRRWSVGLWGKNLTNNYQIVIADDVTSFVAKPGPTRYWKVATNLPRTFGITVSLKR